MEKILENIKSNKVGEKTKTKQLFVFIFKKLSFFFGCLSFLVTLKIYVRIGLRLDYKIVE